MKISDGVDQCPDLNGKRKKQLMCFGAFFCSFAGHEVQAKTTCKHTGTQMRWVNNRMGTMGRQPTLVWVIGLFIRSDKGSPARIQKHGIVMKLKDQLLKDDSEKSLCIPSPLHPPTHSIWNFNFPPFSPLEWLDAFPARKLWWNRILIRWQNAMHATYTTNRNDTLKSHMQICICARGYVETRQKAVGRQPCSRSYDGRCHSVSRDSFSLQFFHLEGYASWHLEYGRISCFMCLSHRFIYLFS